MKRRIHVNQHAIRSGKGPAITVQGSDGPVRAYRVAIDGPAEVIHSRTPLSCGARCWVETDSPVRLLARSGRTRKILR